MASVAERCPVARAGADAPSVPAHVPPELVLDTRFAAGIVPNDLIDPYRPMDVVRDEDFTRVHYYPWPVSGNKPGAWVLTNSEAIHRQLGSAPRRGRVCQYG